MRLRFACRACESTVATGDVSLPMEAACPRCGSRASFAAPTGEGGVIDRCPGCGGPHLFLQKEFPRLIGLGIAAAGGIAFLVLMGLDRIYLGFGTLLGVALLDSIIYRLAPVMTVCYHCQSEFRRHPMNPKHGAFEPKIAFYTAKKGAPAAAAPMAPAPEERPAPTTTT